MRIAIASDFHIGFGKGTPREREPFEQAKQALELALSQKADLLLLPGDLFNDSIPSQEAWLDMFRLFSVIRREKRPQESVKYSKKGFSRDFLFLHLPVVAIAGTHEFRSRDFKNALEVLQEAGCLVLLHAAKAGFEKNGEKVVVQGLSGVPEKKALDALKMWNPLPEKGALNILLLHQSVKEFLPFDDDMVASISLDDLPKGFDLVIDGHLHWSSDKHLASHRLLVPGSTIVTQMKRLESTKPKGIFVFDSEKKAAQFFPLPEQRQFLYEKLSLKDASLEQVRDAIEGAVSKALESASVKPLLKVKAKGSLAKGLAQADLDLGPVREKFREKALLSIDLDFEEADFHKRLEELRSKQLGNKSISAMGFEILEKNLGETDFNEAFDVKRVFDLLEQGDIDRVVELLSRAKKA
jgi:DNA repair exonuclease SbcCD nuclease subunit